MSRARVSLLESDGANAWDAFVNAAPDGTFFHLAGWKSVIERSFGHRTYYLQASRDGRLTGVLPLTHVKTRLFGNAFISNAFCVQGGVVAQDEESRDALTAEAVRIAAEKNAEYIELRAKHSSDPEWLERTGTYVNFSRPIGPDAEANMLAIPRKQRAMVRKGISNGLQSELDDDVARLHDVYAQSVRNLGTPVFPKAYFAALKAEFREHCDVVTIVHERVPVASVMNFYYRDQVLPYYGGGGRRARELAANDFMYWEVMRRAAERGYRVFDFGRSKVGTGAFHFKRNWGFEPTPLSYTFRTFKSGALPDLTPLNPKYKAMIALWRRLPLPLTKLIGPRIVRGLA